MKVYAINGPSFNGILTRNVCVDHKTYSDYDIWNERFESSSTSYYERDYYPFAGETKSDIERAISPYERTKTYGDDTEYNKVNVKQALPVKKSEFLDYINYRLLSSQDAKVHDALVRQKMYDFIKENFIPKKDDYTIL